MDDMRQTGQHVCDVDGAADTVHGDGGGIGQRVVTLLHAPGVTV